MKRRSRPTGPFWIGVLLIASTGAPAAIWPEGENSATEETQSENCPISPVTGNWHLEADEMDLSGVRQPGMGGGGDMVPVWMSCEKKVLTAQIAGLGRVNFYPSKKGPPVIPRPGSTTKLVRDLEATIWPVKQAPEEIMLAEFPGAKLALFVADERALELLRELVTEGEYKGEYAIEPPEEFELTQLPMYRAVAKKERGYELVWYLWFATQYEMFSMTSIETVQGPMHTQFHHWRFSSPFSGN